MLRKETYEENKMAAHNLLCFANEKTALRVTTIRLSIQLLPYSTKY